MKFGIIVSARMGSRRLPGKSLKNLMGFPSILLLLKRLEGTNEDTKIILATTTKPEDDILANKVSEEGYNVYRGSENDLIDRYINASIAYNIKNVVRVTGDCPFVNSYIVNYCMDRYFEKNSYMLTTKMAENPVGIDCEIFSLATLMKIAEEKDLTDEDREHLTIYMYKNIDKYFIERVNLGLAIPKQLNLTLDNSDDYAYLSRICSEMNSPQFSMDELSEQLIKMSKSDS